MHYVNYMKRTLVSCRVCLHNTLNASFSKKKKSKEMLCSISDPIRTNLIQHLSVDNFVTAKKNNPCLSSRLCLLLLKVWFILRRGHIDLAYQEKKKNPGKRTSRWSFYLSVSLPCLYQ